mgnify:CR=1 FL=1
MDEDFTINPEIRNLFKQISEHIRSRMKLIVALFILGMVIGIPISHTIIDWLLDSNLIPDDVNIIILTPVEFIMLQVRVGAWIGVTFAVFWLLIDAAMKTEFLKEIPNPTLAFTKYTIGSVILMASGLIYSWYLLTPMLLEYLATDAQAAGLSTEWRLSSFVGFISGLCFACIVGFQAPLFTLLSINSGAISREDLLQYRRHIWFITFVLGAAFSPPDPLSLFLVAVPIIVLFEAAIFYSSLTSKN